jgi:aminopeptidase N
MENWGLITYRTTAVLFDPATSADSYRNRVAYVVAHELAHQWFGNLVTMDWWSELWLNEGFATWVGWLAIDHLYPGKSRNRSTAFCQLRAKIAQIASRSAEGIFLQTVVLDGLRVLLRDDISNLQPLSFRS